MMLSILFTGGSSFTGCWFVRSLLHSGHRIVATLTRSQADYIGLRALRVADLRQRATLVERTKFGTPEFMAVLREAGPFDLLCHHAAEVTDYNSEVFDPLAAAVNNANCVRDVLSAFKAQGGRAVVLTGSVFEREEGAGEEPRLPLNPYGLSKSITADVLRYYAAAARICLGKFTIPNPFGPFEEPRFTDYLLRTWKAGGVAEVKTPEYVRDNIPIDLLADCYALFASRCAYADGLFLRLNPSGYVESQAAFANRVAGFIRAHKGWACELCFARQNSFSQPLVRVNTDSARRLFPSWDEQGFWNDYAAYVG